MATPVRSASADALRRNALTVWPGMTIFWIGDLGHQGTESGHNPDDFPPLRAELQDSDLVPEVRALDFMVGPKFTASDGTRLVNALIRGVDQQRLYYVIYRSTIWRRATGFQPQTYNGSNNHNGHVHTSGHSSDDANGSDWKSVLAIKEATTMDPGGYNASSILRGLCLGHDMVRQINSAGAESTPVSCNALVDRIAKRVIQLLPTGGGVGLTKPDVAEVVRAELDKTTLGSGT